MTVYTRSGYLPESMIKSLRLGFLRRVKESGEEMRILGIDPGYALMGYGIIEKKGNQFTVCDYGSISTEAGAPHAPETEVSLFFADGYHRSVAAGRGGYRGAFLQYER